MKFVKKIFDVGILCCGALRNNQYHFHQGIGYISINFEVFCGIK